MEQDEVVEEEEENEIDEIVRLSNLLNERNKRTIEEDKNNPAKKIKSENYVVGIPGMPSMFGEPVPMVAERIK